MSLSFKISFLLLLTFALLLSLFGWHLIVDERKELKILLDRQGTSLARAVSSFSIEPLLVEDYPVLETVLSTIGEQTGDILSIEVLFHDNKVASYTRGRESEGQLYRHDIVFKTGYGDEEHRLGEVRLVLSQRRNDAIIDQRISEMRFSFAIIFVVLIGALVVILRKTVLHRVESLSNYAEAITAEQRRNNPSVEIPARPGAKPEGIGGSLRRRWSGDEISRLATNLSIMRGAIDEKEDLLKQYAEGLERKIEERTQELIRAKDAAESSDRAKSSFLANMSHEIRTPMGGVIGFAELLARTSLDSKQQEYVRIVSMSARNLRTIIDDLLDYTKIEQGRMKIETRPFNLLDVVDESINLLTPQAYSKEIELTQGIAADAPTLLVGDAVRIRQILTNLTSNAVKFTATGSVSLWIERVLKNGNLFIRFEVVDTGIGIATRDLPRLFRPFSQADVSMTRRFGGTGLGLAISNQLVEQMNGTLGVETKLGRGSLFWFELPLEEQADSSHLTNRIDGLNDLSALVYDPEEQSARAISHALRRMGLRSETMAALDDLSPAATRAAERWDLIVSGLARDADTDALRQALKTLKGHFDAPVVVLLNQADPVSYVKQRQIPCDVALSKATGYQAFAKAVAGLLAVGRNSDVAANKASLDERAWYPGLTVMVADDDPINLMLAKALLESKGIQVIEAMEGREAVRLAQTRKPDLIFMDIQMPNVSGIDATRQIREQEINARHTPIIAVTAHAHPKAQEAFLALGIDDCIIKPLDHERIWRLINRWVHRERLGQAPVSEERRTVPGKVVHDRVAALQAAGGNRRVAAEIWGMLLSQLPEFPHRIEAALAVKDYATTQHEAHRIVGSAAICCVPALKSATAALEKAIDEREFDRLPGLVAALQDEVSCLLDYARRNQDLFAVQGSS